MAGALAAAPECAGAYPPARPCRRVHLVVRPGLPPTSGNVVTARRLCAGLAAAGLESRVIDADVLDAEASPGPDEVVHALHARWAGLPALNWAPCSPVVWTFTGTDFDGGELDALREGARRVRALVVFHDEAAAEVRRALPEAAHRVRVIRPGVELPGGVEPGTPRGDRGVLFLLPAGIRAVKAPDLAVAAVAAVRQAGLEARLQVAGPARDPAFHNGFLTRLAPVPFAAYLGEVPPEGMGRLYAQADVVLNTSRAEGLSNAVLEAMASGRAVLATDIPGNRAAIRHGSDGWLAAPADLPSAAVRLARDPELRTRLGTAARASVAARFSPEAEVAAHLQLYSEVSGHPAQTPPRG
jgi:glycosyltransferase involved in cell wall biosynthesis